ncbi:MAG: hypothetical protein HZA01_17130 [Nitrospinae bacterium]|nr:hypothetical protein [Nitrospinota bacterium]
MNRIYLSILIICFLLGTCTLIAFVKAGESISGNLYPELIGFCLDGIFFVILFTVYEGRRFKVESTKQKIKLKKSLRDLLAIILQWSQPINSKIPFKEIILNPDNLKAIQKELESTRRLDGVQADFLRIHALARIPSIQAAIPVSATIDGRHLQLWDLILNNLRAIAESTNDENAYEALLDFINFVIKFDEAQVSA